MSTFLLLSPIEGRRQPLQVCGDDVELAAGSSSNKAATSEGLSTCIAQREEEAAIHHQLVLQKPEYNQKVSLKCPLCPGELSSSFVWYFIPRGPSPIFESSKGSVSLISPGGKPLTQDLFSGTAIPCLINRTYDLYIPNFNREVHVGTYYCRNVEESSHLANFIWYHVDVVLPADSEGRSSSIPDIPTNLEGVQKVSHFNDVKVIMKTVGSFLRNHRNFTDFETPVLSITSRVTATPTPSRTCGSFSLQRFKQCFVRLPRTLSQQAREHASPVMVITYDLLRALFGSFYTWLEEENPTVRITQRKAAETRAEELGFELFYEGKAEEEPEEGQTESEEDFLNMDEGQMQYYYIPCHFTFLQHVNLSGELPRPFDIKNLMLEVAFQVPCPEVDYMDIVNLALASKDTKALKKTILGYEDKRYMKLEKVAIVGSKDFEILCGGEGDTLNYNCSDRENQTILWKHEKGVLLYFTK